MRTFTAIFKASALLLSIWYLHQQRARAIQSRWVSRFMRSNGIEEEIELHGDGTYRQTLTDSSGNTFDNFGTWHRSGALDARFDFVRSPSILLNNHVDALEVVRKQSVEEARKKDATYESYCFCALDKDTT